MRLCVSLNKSALSQSGPKLCTAMQGDQIAGQQG